MPNSEIKIIFQSGKCMLTKEMICWPSEFSSFWVASARIWELKQNDPRVFDWITHMATKSWLSPEDFRDFCLVFAFAITYFVRPESCTANFAHSMIAVNEKLTHLEAVSKLIEKH